MVVALRGELDIDVDDGRSAVMEGRIAVTIVELQYVALAIESPKQPNQPLSRTTKEDFTYVAAPPKLNNILASSNSG